MKNNEIKQLVRRVIEETLNSESSNVESDLDNIITWASNAKRHIQNRQNPQVFHNLIKAIRDKSQQMLEAGVDEGYGTGDPNTDPKFAGNWKVHFPSEKDWDKNKKSLDPVYEATRSAEHLKKELDIYKALKVVISKLLELHSTPTYDQHLESKYHKLLNQLTGRLNALYDKDTQYVGA